MDANEKEIRAYYQGLREGVTRFAYWKDGEQFVGTCGVSLRTALADIDDDERKDIENANYYNGGKL